MVGPQHTTTGFIKSVFYKSCFLLGLGTATFYAYGQVCEWANPAAQNSSSITQNSEDLQGKLTQITETHDGGAVPMIRGIRRRITHAFAAPAPVEAVALVPVVAADPLAIPAPAPVVNADGSVVKSESVIANGAAVAAASATPVDPNAPVVPVDPALAGASPSPSPGASPANGEAQAAIDPNAPVDPNGAQVNGSLNAQGVPYQQPMDANGNPVQFPYAFQAPNTQSVDGIDRTISSDANSTTSGAATSSASTQNLNGPGTSLGVSNISNTAPSTSSSGSYAPVGPAKSRSINGGITGSSGTLSAQDLQLLTSSALHGSFTNRTLTVSGLSPQNVTTPVTISSMSWGNTDTLSSEASIALTNSTSGGVNGTITLNVVSAGANHPVTFNVTSATVPHSSTDGAGKKTFVISFNDQNVLGSYTLTRMQAVMVFDASGNLNPGESTFTFLRTGVPVFSVSDAATPYTADVPYSMILNR